MSYKITYNPPEDRVLVRFETPNMPSLAATRRQITNIVYQLHRINDAPEELYRTTRPANNTAGKQQTRDKKEEVPDVADDVKLGEDNAGNVHGTLAAPAILVRSVAVLKTPSGACVSFNYRPPQGDSVLAVRFDLAGSDIAAFGRQLVNLCQYAGWDLEAAHERLNRQKVAPQIRHTQLN